MRHLYEGCGGGRQGEVYCCFGFPGDWESVMVVKGR